MALKDQQQLFHQLQEQISLGKSLVEQLNNVENIDGILKLQRKIRQEIQFLLKLESSKKVKLEQLSCSNLRHLGALVDCALRPGVVAVCKNIHISEDTKLVIDVISEEGKIWTKVIARNPKSLSALIHGKASYGARTILDQAEDYLHGADMYPYMYKPPKVIFEFTSGIEENLASKLQRIGVEIRGNILPNSETEEWDDSWESETSEENYVISNEDVSGNTDNYTLDNKDGKELELDTLNLDVTTMMAYVSNMTNGHCNYIFQQPVLTQQSEWEALRPVKPILEKLFVGKKLVCCETAWNDFEKIVNTLGGPKEKQRTADLKAMLSVLPDDTGGNDDFPRSNLKVRGNVRQRSKIIFNFGHRIKALTISANEGFVRAAKQQNVRYAALIHESRALTEGKESTATKINSS